MLRTSISIVGLVLAGGIFFMYTQPSYDKSKGIQARIAEYDAALQKAAELQQLKQSLLSRYNAFDPEDVDRLHKLLPDHVDNVRLILDMDSMAAARNMTLANVEVSGGDTKTSDAKTVIGAIGAESKKYDSLDVGFSTNGTYTNFKQFLSDLEKSLRIVDLTQLGLSPTGTYAPSAPGATPEPVYTYTVTLKVYWLK